METEVQRSEVAFPRSHGQLMAGLGFEWIPVASKVSSNGMIYN